jgi:1-acyl-sn-glycerol-3-phosphate acyltransferase
VTPDPSSPYFYRPPPGSGWLASLAWRALRCWRWRTVLAGPLPRKCVIVFYPHTSNWDALVGLLTKWAFGLDVRWAAKDTLFRSPLAPLFRSLGGIPVNRRQRTGFSGAMGEAFAGRDDLRLVIEPEATRSYAPCWKSGFYHIARTAGVPLAFGFIDYSRREIGFLGNLEPTGDVAADMARIAAIYAGRIGRNPRQQGPVRLCEPTDARC